MVSKLYTVEYVDECGRWRCKYEGSDYDYAYDCFRVFEEAERSARIFTMLMQCKAPKEKEMKEEENTYNIPTFTVEDTNRTPVHLTVREYFAAQALNAAISSRTGIDTTFAAQLAVEYADALIKRLAE